MRKSFIFTFFIFITLSCMAQDTLLLRDKSVISCRVTQVRLNSIEYSPVGSFYNTSRFYQIPKEDVQYIFYATGTIDTINPIIVYQPSQQLDSLAGSDTSTNHVDSKIRYAKGFDDGYESFDAHSAKVTSGIIGGVFGVYGLISPIVYSASKVKPSKINDSRYLMSNDVEYRSGFENGSTKKQRRQAWSGFGVGYGIRAAVVAVAILVFIATF